MSGTAGSVQDVKVVQDGDDEKGAEEGEHGAKDPEEEGQRSVEEAVADRVEEEALLEQVTHVVLREEPSCTVIVINFDVNEEVDLVKEADGK